METIESDYVVVGSGSGGAVVSARLSEDARNSVLLLEAGPSDDHRWIRMPIGFARVLVDPKVMWHLESEPERYLGGRPISALRGKVLGGSSSVNGLIYIRGAPSDYAIWRQLGGVGWGYEDVLPYFKKAERFQHGADEFHGGDGPLGVEDAGWRNPLADAFVSSAMSLGLPERKDFCRRDIEGAGYYQMTTWKGRRVSAAHAYLKPARRRANLRIETEALASRIEFDGRRAKAVLFKRDGKLVRAVARQEIILCAGSFGTPALLQRSGVGPAWFLAERGITAVHDLPGVGQNLMDHILAKRGYTTTSTGTFNWMMRSPISQGLAGLRYLLRNSGPLTVGAALAGGHARTRDGLEDPDIQFFYMPFEAGDYSGKLPKVSSFQISFYQNRPESRGHVRIRSAAPEESPEIVLNYYSSEADVRTTIAGLRFIERIGAAAPLRALGAEEMAPSAGLRTDEELLSYARATASSGYHHVGSCRLGEDGLAVVGPDLRVRGLDGLRIADGSVMPTLTSGNTNSVCIMIGEKAADMIAKAA